MRNEPIMLLLHNASSLDVCACACVCMCVLYMYVCPSSSQKHAFSRIREKKRITDEWTDQGADGWIDSWSDQWINRPSYRDARTYLRITNQEINNSSMFELKDFIVISYPLNASALQFKAIMPFLQQQA